MLHNYLRIGFRSLLKNKVYTLINIIGLATGIASCLLILIYVENELSYDKFHTKSSDLYKMVLERIYPDHVTNYAFVPHSFSSIMVQDFPEVKNATRVFGTGNNPVIARYVDEREEEKVFEETRFFAADSNFFDLFSFEIIKGDKTSPLSGIQDVVITEATASKYFGDDDPINKTIKTDFGDFTVKAVCRNVPENSHFQFDFMASIRSIPFIQQENFIAFSVHIYIEKDPEASLESLKAKFPEMVDTYAAPQIEQTLNISYTDYTASGNGYNYTFIPLEDLYLYPTKYQGSFKAGGDINDIYIFISIAFLIVIIACINFMNLATARSTERAREVGVRKTLGSPKKQLIGQFLTESVILSCVATVVAVAMVYLALPYFNSLTDKNLTFGAPGSMAVPMTIALALLVGLLAGIYPAFFLSAFSPVSVLKGNMQTKKSSQLLRNGLVICQFAISIILIASTLTVRDQISYIQNKGMGYEKNKMLVIERADVLNDQRESFMKELRKMPQMAGVGGSGSIPVSQYFGRQFMPPGSSEVLTVNAMTMDDHYMEAMNFELLEGRTFSEDFNDSLAIIINQKTAELLDTDNPIGLKLSHTDQADPGLTREFEIIGIVKDFHYMSLREEISPFVLMSTEGPMPNTPFITARISGDIATTIAQVEDLWQTLAPQEPFKYKFLDEELQEQYNAEQNSGGIFTLFAFLAIIIACVGLFGLAAYMAGLRTKEIGVRKVMGASVVSVVLLLSYDFTKLIFIALVLAVPVSWYFMDQWLNSFAYKTNISASTFIVSGAIALGIAILTVSYQSVKAAVVNPVKSLKDQ
ncbi:FtsX-like permease family protein [Fulvivirga sp. M361]|uniref:ABC transporter permease n=1 Tax=Fulvivirga sp. M361 TaxID=2594266 RepID=UPI00117AD44F|nr:ABC transporter permease [Fulvivirga sp. M361]TRX53037.1 FtsX-like permease family protein [Fulvivirga sp. M361]